MRWKRNYLTKQNIVFNVFFYWMKFNVATFLVAMFIKVIRSTMRFDYNSKQLIEVILNNNNNERCILAFYHRRLVMMPNAYFLNNRICEKHSRKISILSSSSKDGEFSARIWRWFGVYAVRGTASRNGATALVKMIKAVHGGFDLAVTVDGPRGPRYFVKPGVLAVSAKTQSWVVPVCIAYSNAWKIKSWDEMLIPKPFSSAIIRYNTPFKVSIDNDIFFYRELLQKELDEMEQWANATNESV